MIIVFFYTKLYTKVYDFAKQKIVCCLNRIKIIYLNKPSKKEYKCDKIQVSMPVWKAVNLSVHKEHPSLLAGCLVHCFDAYNCKTLGIN